jgi:MFS transporter, NNP family, nitrate/nitrite transporter
MADETVSATALPDGRPAEWYAFSLHSEHVKSDRCISSHHFYMLLFILRFLFTQHRKKYNTYYINVDPDQDDKATELKLFSFARPHMRSFHLNWFGFFMAFFIWFAIAPLLPEIKKTLKLTKDNLFASSMIGVSGTIMMRFLLGPLIDKYGARIPFTMVLCCCAIPTACLGFVESLNGLYILRLFIGLAGGSFVMCQSWTSAMFAKNVVGTANAVAGGWGNLGGGVTHLLMGKGFFPLFKHAFGSAETSWRFICVIPAIVTFTTGFCMYFCTDDLPKGNFAELKRHGTIVEVSATKSFKRGATNFNSWILALQYACSFGVEICMQNTINLYFKDEFKLSTEDAAAVASIFGFFNIFSRASGGILSDVCNRRVGMKGRIYLQFVALLLTATFVLLFQSARELWLAILYLCFFSVTVQAACGTTYGIVPYVDPTITGSVSGIVGAGGNIGSVGFLNAFRKLKYHEAFKVMGFTVYVAAASCLFVRIKGCSTFFGGVDVVEAVKTLEVPEMAKEQPDGVSANKVTEKEIEEEYA